MGNKINVAQLLKDCPQGMELDCTMYENVTFVEVGKGTNALYPIYCITTDENGNRSGCSFTKNGCASSRNSSKCVIFPKGKTTWEEFVPPCQFKDGDIVAATIFPEHTWIAIFKQNKGETFEVYCSINAIGEFHDTSLESHVYTYTRHATEEEKQRLFDAIRANGFKWNAETKTLEKLFKSKFKVGDRVKENKSYIIGTVTDILDDSIKVTYDGGGCCYVFNQDKWELVPNKFDISTLKPFGSRVLMRDKIEQDGNYGNIWCPAIFGMFCPLMKEHPFVTLEGLRYEQCIPYEGNEHLLGTTDDCDNYYKTWGE